MRMLRTRYSDDLVLEEDHFWITFDDQHWYEVNPHPETFTPENIDQFERIIEADRSGVPGVHHISFTEAYIRRGATRCADYKPY